MAAAPRGTPAPSINFLVKPEEKRKYDALFNQLKPVNGILPGDKVHRIMDKFEGKKTAEHSRPFSFMGGSFEKYIKLRCCYFFFIGQRLPL